MRRTVSRRPGLFPVVGAAVLLLALALRLWRAEVQSLWYDEGASVALAGRTVAQIARDAANDIHPPLYYWLLAGWVRAFGDGVGAVRALSALLGTAVVGFVLVLGRRLFGVAPGLTAGVFAALSPYLVWYSQEVRMYILAALWACALVYVALRLAEAVAAGTPGRGRWTVSAALVSLAALYTHYLGGGGALAVGGAVVLLAAWRARRATGRWPVPLLARWAVAGAAAVALFLPWLAYARHAIGSWPATSPPVTAAYVARESVTVLGLGARVPPEALVFVPWLAVVAAIGLLASLWIPSWRFPVAVAGAWLAVPLALLWLMSLAKPAWNPKQIVVAAPGLELLLAAGAMALPALVVQRAGKGGPRGAALIGAVVVSGVLVAALIVPRVRALRAMYVDPAYQRDDYRGIAATIDQLAGPRDAVLLNAPTQVEIYGYYDRGRHRTYPLPLSRPADPADTAQRLASLAGRHRDVYAILWATDESDPDGLVERWLNERRYKVSDDWFGNVRLAVWADARPMVGGPRGALGSPMLGDALALGYLSQPGEPVRAGDVLTMQAHWRALKPAPVDYVVFTQLLAPDGRMVAGRDMAPLGGSARTSTWTDPEVEHVDRIGLRVPADLAPGDYTLILGLYDPATGERLPVRGDDPSAPPADRVTVGTVRVLR